jgi:hypothetical protein
MSKPLFVCVKCGQDFTREYGARRHNRIHHLGRSPVVGCTEYIIGRSRGTIPPPTEITPRLFAIRKRKGKMMKNGLAYIETRSPFTVYPDSTSDNPISHKDVFSPDVVDTQPKKNEPLDEIIANYSDMVQLMNLQKVLSGNTNMPLVPTAVEPNFSNINSQTSESSFLGDIITNFKNLARLQGLVKELLSNSTTNNHSLYQPPPKFRAQPTANSFFNQISAIEPIVQKRDDIFGFSGMVCDHCLSFEFVAHCFNNHERDGLVIPTKHTCKQATSEQLFNGDETNDRIDHIRQNMLISLAAATRTWTEDKTSVHALKLSTQADGKISEILSIEHPSLPDKSVKIPLKSVSYIDLVIGRENHWVYRAVKELQTPLQPYELEDFFLRTRTSTFAIFRVKILYRSRQQPSFLGTFFVYLAKAL